MAALPMLEDGAIAPDYDKPVAYSAKPQNMRFVPPRGPGNPVVSAGFNRVNTGTCEINQARYFDTAVRARGATDSPTSPHVPADACVDWHFTAIAAACTRWRGAR
ncbi:hypothetical protein ABIC63_005996 [Pseudacidovorax sp. 1753]